MLVPWKDSLPPRWKPLDAKGRGYSTVTSGLGEVKILEMLKSTRAPVDGLAPYCWRCSDGPPVHAIQDESPRWAPKTALHLAVCSRSFEATEWLVEGGARMTADNPDGPEIDGHLFLPNVRGRTTLHELSRLRAPGSDATDFAKHAITNGSVDVGATTSEGVEPWATACSAGQYKITIASWSLESNVDCRTRIPSWPSDTILHVALDACYDMGTAPLAYDTGNGCADCLEGRHQDLVALAYLVNLLIQNGLDVDAQDGDDRTGLHIAATLGDVGVVDALLDEGAPPAVRDGTGGTALSIAKKQSRRLRSNKWSALPGTSPATGSSGNWDEGFVPRGFVGLLRATEQAGSLINQAGRHVFHLRELR
ncbi:ankyrin repeat protein [Colletotrichum incanum]|uniref:Ankyrin repeat protein n=1 Tax=Colletotrichum incanum TaxID=1573173 RepID=A0A167AZ91_COLIC|nr:ankyrin repeat protein [Colletotrichum incanum]OHW96281.1 ankyrin repeat protein [Colletotrichum incanum]